ncbi:MAG: ArsR family transcriptional regulator [Candidatus Magasanikbacteria bacterium CG_4_10_14_0_2_um_filter_33_14]|uniref:ArsR family transcriptional regulator n=1 Tax=Candidatus Magasanikbacteria bacterium CG_4_10_14_0_2_um_filter_33_14 TaxID=1974636 RepID=A0A2M7VC57_9BACT|nr:MAG: ArsR family transcriptional regulator [Candidatus Magasanikbacteria bacterium CG_4_10_14_0_2_um_filter_33_14]
MPKIKCCSNKKISNELKKTVDFLKIISEENRMRILCILKSGPKCVCEIWPNLDLSQNLTSHHLSVLKEFGLVKSKKQGLKVFYELNDKNLQKQLINLDLFLK